MSTTSPANEPAPNTLTDAQKAEGWQLLFDGTTKNGWHIYNNRTDGAAWKVENGTLYLDPQAKMNAAMPRMMSDFFIRIIFIVKFLNILFQSQYRAV